MTTNTLSFTLTRPPVGPFSSSTDCEITCKTQNGCRTAGCWGACEEACSKLSRTVVRGSGRMTGPMNRAMNAAAGGGAITRLSNAGAETNNLPGFEGSLPGSGQVSTNADNVQMAGTATKPIIAAILGAAAGYYYKKDIKWAAGAAAAAYMGTNYVVNKKVI